MRMAAYNLAKGRQVAASSIDNEITYFLLAKEFHWTPEEIDRQDAKKMKALTTILSVYNKVSNSEMKRVNKSKK